MRRRLLVLAAVVLAVAIAIWATAGPPKPQPTPPGTFAFAALGDAPYMPWEILQYRLVVRELDAHDLAFVAHVGDIFWRPCSDEHYREVRARFDAMRHPLFYTPGDNEWADCWEDGAGSFEPLERLDSLRAIFFDDPSRSLGREKLPAESQGGAFRENVRWGHDGVVFATVHVVGSDNARAQFPGRRKADDAAVTERTEAASAWMRETFAAARASGAPAVVLFFHAHPYRRPAWEPFVSTLEEEARRFAGPVLVVHGDGHEYYVDRPFRAKNITRVQVPGSPRVGWVRIVVDVKARDPFSFDEHVVPRWKYW
jgi:hypothetical protein